MIIGKDTAVRYSLDGGETWIDIEVTDVQIKRARRRVERERQRGIL